LKAIFRAVAVKPVNGNITAAMRDHFQYFVPHVAELLSGDSEVFAVRLEMRRPFVPVSKPGGYGFQGSVDPRGPMAIGNNIIYGAIRLVSTRFPKPEECYSMAREWLSRDQLAGIESGRMAAVIGVSRWGGSYVATIAVVADMNKP